MIDKQQLVKSGLWQILNIAIIFSSQVVFFYVMARIVSKEEFGEMAILLAIVNFASVVTEAGMGDALMQRKHVEPGHKNAAMFFSVGVGIFFYFLLFFLAPWIANVYHEPILQPTLRVLGFCFIFNSFGSSSLNLLQKEFKFKKTFMSDCFSLVLSTIIGIILGYKLPEDKRVWALVFQYLLYFFFKSAMLWIQEPLPVKLGAKIKHYKELLNYGVGLTLVRLNVYAINYGVNLLVGKLVTIATLGVFERADRLVIIPGRYLGEMVQRINIPNMVKHSDDNDKLFTIYTRGMSLLNSILFPVAIFWSVFAKPIVLFVMGKNWLEAVIPMQILFISLPFRVAVRDSDALMRVKRLLYKNVSRKFQYLVLLCIAIYIGSHWGLIGITSGILITTVQNYFGLLMVIRRRIFPTQKASIMFRPFYQGIFLSVCYVLPAYGVYLLLNTAIKSQLYCFFIVTLILIGIVALFFFKKPELLGKDIHALRNELMKVFDKKKKIKTKGLTKVQNAKVEEIFEEDDQL